MKKIDELNTILLDDDNFALKSTKGMLHVLGAVNVVATSNIEEAKTAMQMVDFDGAIVDLVLRDGSGLSFGEYCNSKDVPIVFLTGTNDGFNELLMLQLGWILHKPASSAGLRRCLEFFKTYSKTAKTVDLSV